MKIEKIVDPSIAKEPYEQSWRINLKLSYEKWVEFIEMHKDYYIWLENTPEGILKKNNIDKYPENFREGILLKLNKQQALAEFNIKKGWHEIVIDFHRDTCVIKTTFMKKIKKEHLQRLLEMANYLDALLLNNGTEIIDEKVIEKIEQ